MNHQSEIELDTDAATETADPSGALEQRICAARVRLLYSGIGLAAAVNVINAAILATVYRNMIGGGMMLGWLGFMAASILWRVWLVSRFRTAAPADAAMGNWARRYMLGSLWTGSAWGLAGFIMLPEAAPAHQIVTVGVLGGSAAGAITTLTRHYPAYFTFVFPALTPVVIHFARVGGETGYGMAVMSTLFMMILLYAGRKQSDALEQSLRLSMENQGLVDHLTEEKARAGQLNAELRREMAEREK